MLVFYLGSVVLVLLEIHYNAQKFGRIQKFKTSRKTARQILVQMG